MAPDMNKSFQQLKKASLKDSTRALIMAAQEAPDGCMQESTAGDRTQTDAPETVQHIVAGCKRQARTPYTGRHN